MKNGRFVAIVGGALLGAVVVSQAQAQVPYPDRATVYQVKFVRAMDECMGPGVTIVNPGSIAGCTQVNSVTDAGLTAMSQGNLKVSRRRNGAYIRFTGKGFAPAGTPIGIQLTLRTTNRRGLPASTSKTYEDQTIICGDTIGGSCGNFTNVQSNGRIVLRQSLGDCLTLNGLSQFIGSGNIEIIDSALINCTTGKIAAVPGILQEPLQ